MNHDLDMTMNADSWVHERPVYCPVPWCNAHKLRHVRCGDPEGDYEGIHVARIKYVARFMKNEEQRVKFFRDMGVTNPELSAGMGRALQDAVDSGLVKGRRGRRH